MDPSKDQLNVENIDQAPTNREEDNPNLAISRAAEDNVKQENGVQNGTTQAAPPTRESAEGNQEPQLSRKGDDKQSGLTADQSQVLNLQHLHINNAMAGRLPAYDIGGDDQRYYDNHGGEENSDEDDSEDSSSDMSAQDDDSSWISWFCSLRGNEFFCEIDEDYIRDDFNLTGLSSKVNYYDYALDLILDMESPNEENFTEEQQETIETAAELLYGLVHSRYILTNRGMQQMYIKYQNAHFGKCHRVLCNGQPVLPMGQFNTLEEATVCVFCPQCRDIYYPKSRRQGSIDGACFGTTFPHLFLLQHPDLIPARSTETFIPRIYGFRVNKESPYYQNRPQRRQQKDRDRKKNERQRSNNGNLHVQKR